MGPATVCLLPLDGNGCDALRTHPRAGWVHHPRRRSHQLTQRTQPLFERSDSSLDKKPKLKPTRAGNPLYCHESDPNATPNRVIPESALLWRPSLAVLPLSEWQSERRKNCPLHIKQPRLSSYSHTRSSNMFAWDVILNGFQRTQPLIWRINREIAANDLCNHLILVCNCESSRLLAQLIYPRALKAVKS